MTRDKTKKSYWDSIWRVGSSYKKLDPNASNIGNYVTRMFHAYFVRIFSPFETKNLKLLEIGCANSAWLPYFSKEFGFDVSGLDYSDIGCEKAKKNLKAEGISGMIECADLFSPPPHLLGVYDVVVSFGVVEHFNDTGKCLGSLLKFLKNDGLLITNIPNMVGYTGLIQKYINRPVFGIHKLIAKDDMIDACNSIRCEILECEYFVSTNFGICNVNGICVGSPEWLIKKIILAVLSRVSMLVWRLEEKRGRFRANKAFSPYINCLIKKQ